MLTMKEKCKYIVLLPWLQAPMFSWPRLTDADPLLRCEMSSTGEVGSCVLHARWGMVTFIGQPWAKTYDMLC